MGTDLEPKEKGFTHFDLESKQPRCLVSNLWTTYLCGSISPTNEKTKQQEDAITSGKQTCSQEIGRGSI